LEMRSSFWPRPCWTMTLLFYAFHQHAQVFVLGDGVSQTFLPRFTWNYTPLDLSLPCSHVVGVSHWYLAYSFVFEHGFNKWRLMEQRSTCKQRR
jgi:hypothetical protein